MKAELERRKAKNRKGLEYSPHKPTPRQMAFLGLECLEALYGGAAGGGKSDALLMAALQYAHVPGYAALILRRTYADLALPGAIMDRAKSWLIPQGVPWNDKDKRFTFPSGATLTFGYLDTEQDRYRYQGAELQYVGFDELTQFPEQWYRYLLSRLRRLQGASVPIRARAASNPGGVGHDWVRRRFVEQPERPDSETTNDDRHPAFVPATLRDNPHLDAEAYEQALNQLDETTRRQLKDGQWVRDGGGLVYPFDEALNVIDRAPPLTHFSLGADYGVTDATAYVIAGWREHDPNVYFVEAFKERGLTPSLAAQRAHDLNARITLERMVGDVGGLGKGFAEEARARFNLPIEPAQKANKRGYQSLFVGDIQAGRIKVVRGACKDLLDEWSELPWSADRTKESDGFDNHCADAALYVWRDVRNYHERSLTSGPAYGSPEWARAEHERMLADDIERIERSQRDRLRERREEEMFGV